MQSLALLLSVVLVGLAVAQTPVCSDECFTNAIMVSNCNIALNTTLCMCNNNLYQTSLSKCLCASSCSDSDILAAQGDYDSLCATYQSLPINLPGCPAGGGSSPTSAVASVSSVSNSHSSAASTATSSPSTSSSSTLSTRTSSPSTQNTIVLPSASSVSSNSRAPSSSNTFSGLVASDSSKSTASATSKVSSSSIGPASMAAQTSLSSPTSSSKGLSAGAKAGIAIGVIIGVLIPVVAFLLWRRRRQNKLAAEPIAELEVEGRGRYEADSGPVVEADSKRIGPDEDTTKHLPGPDMTAIEKVDTTTKPGSPRQFQAQPYEEYYSSQPSTSGLEQNRFSNLTSDRGSTLIGTSSHTAGTSPAVPAAPFESPNPSNERDSLPAEAREAERDNLQRQLSELQEEKERHLRLEEIARQEREVRDRLSALE